MKYILEKTVVFLDYKKFSDLKLCIKQYKIKTLLNIF